MTFAAAHRPVAWARSLAFAVLSGIATAPFLLLWPLILAPRGVVWAIVRVHIAVQVALLRRVAGVGYRVTGLENLPDGPCVLASRHEAMWETIFLPWILGNPAVILKHEILGYPVAGPVARKLGHIGVDRSGDLEAAKRSFDQARDEARAGRSVLIFPSGTRDPAEKSSVQGGVAVLYRHLKLPCVPIVLNSGRHWVYRSWLRLPGTIRIEILPPIPPGLRTAEFMERLQTAMAREVGDDGG
ncbi:MAG: lysophospholipid acyltransferase family protein [Rhodobacter sp.]|nr:lysophospholipid acyltransferase family protein [Rhodobacter sp.]